VAATGAAAGAAAVGCGAGTGAGGGGGGSPFQVELGSAHMLTDPLSSMYTASAGSPCWNSISFLAKTLKRNRAHSARPDASRCATPA